MRIIAGDLKGRTLACPQGQGTRPTTDRVRESIMSCVFSARGGFEDAMVLDAFAGSGALGFEALSRGAARAVLYEKDAAAHKVLSANAAKLGLDARRATLVRADVMERPPRFSRPAFDLVFLDPPYAYSAADVLGMIKAARDAGVVSADAIIVYEHATADDDACSLVAAQAGFCLAQRKKYGDTTVDVYRASC